jgi:nucleoside 2-deoxyribosyltransferase
MVKVYLAGTIDGLTIKQATEWRVIFARRLKERFADKVEVLDPTKAVQESGIPQDDILDLKNFSLEEADAVFQKDIAMLSESNLMIVYIQGKSPNIGTIFELGYAKAKNIPAIAYIDNPVKNHAFVKNAVRLCDRGHLDDLLDIAFYKIRKIIIEKSI